MAGKRTFPFPRQNSIGFTLIELLIVIAIISILSAIAVPNFIKYREKAYNTQAVVAAKNIFVATRSYFMDKPLADFKGGTPAAEGLGPYGYNPKDDVVVSVSGTIESLIISARHNNSSRTYLISSTGRITKVDP